MKAICIQPDSKMTESPVETYSDCWAFAKLMLNDSMIEHAPCYWNGKRTHMMVDEEGLLKDLETNEIATAAHSISNDFLNTIYGTVVILPPEIDPYVPEEETSDG